MIDRREIKCSVCGAEVTQLGEKIARASGWWHLADSGTWRCPQHMTWQVLKARLLSICDQIDATSVDKDPGMRDAVEALPDRTLISRLPKELRAPIEFLLSRVPIGEPS